MARFILVEEALWEEKVERNRRRRHRRNTFRINSIPDNEFVATYRLSRELFEELCQNIVPLMPPRRNVRSIDPVVKVLIALNFLARGSYQGSVGLNVDMPTSQQTVSKCIRDVTTAINAPHILHKYIKFPQNRNERGVIKRKFYNKFKIPGVVGCIDCTHIAIVRPSQHEERFFNRKHFHSLNVQIICDTDCNILNVDASYGGATHDCFIWAHSEINDHLRNLHGETAFLLGDSGYSQREYMMTPIENAIEDSPEGRYNFIQKCARSTVERTFGILKGRWRCLLAARQLHYIPEVAGKITLACCLLHNMCIHAGIDAPSLAVEDINEENTMQDAMTNPPVSSNVALEQGRRARNDLVQLLERNNNR